MSLLSTLMGLIATIDTVTIWGLCARLNNGILFCFHLFLISMSIHSFEMLIVDVKLFMFRLLYA